MTAFVQPFPDKGDPKVNQWSRRCQIVNASGYGRWLRTTLLRAGEVEHQHLDDSMREKNWADGYADAALLARAFLTTTAGASLPASDRRRLPRGWEEGRQSSFEWSIKEVVEHPVSSVALVAHR
jgi:hypothetical protein